MAEAKVRARIESREVLADAYLGPNKRGRRDDRVHGHRRMLRHAVLLEELGGEEGTRETLLCNRVSPHSLADECAGDKTNPPTCPSCLAAARKLRRQGRVA